MPDAVKGMLALVKMDKFPEKSLSTPIASFSTTSKEL